MRRGLVFTFNLALAVLCFYLAREIYVEDAYDAWRGVESDGNTIVAALLGAGGAMFAVRAVFA